MASRKQFAAEIDQAHIAFRADLLRLENTVRPSSAPRLEDVRAALQSARTDTSEHFRLEEQSEWMDVVSKRGPALERSIQHFRQEHRELLEALGTLQDLVQAAGKVDDVLREKIHKWIERVRRHELSEDELIEEAYTLDLGTGD